MAIGVCYFPEHWDRDRWETDVEMMAEAGIEVVRMAEFSWAVLEPARGEFDFSWLDEAVALLDDHGISVVLCTPTAAPPKWLLDEHPDILQEEQDGTTRSFGSRRTYCFNSPTYREETDRIVTAMADHYSDHDAVVGWQTDNEYGCHGTARCFCEDCAEAFREWLRAAHGDVETLNERWGTTFWSHTYDSFEAVDPPRHTPYTHHPAHLLDYARFTSDGVIGYNRLQVDRIREANDEWFVTHNFMSNFPDIDVHEMSDDLDFVSWDSYPTGHAQGSVDDVSTDDLRAGDPDVTGLNHDLYRGAKREPFWILEQQPGDVNWPPHNPQPGEGMMRTWAHHAVAHGADTVAYFRWRRCLQGQEKYHSGLLKRDGTPDRGYHDAAQAADDLDEYAPVEASVAIVHDYEDWWALGIEPAYPEFEYWDVVRTYYAGLRAHGVQVDVVSPSVDLDAYDLVVAPSLHLADSDLAGTLEAYVESGGELVMGARSGVNNRYHNLHDAPAPGPFADLVGATVDQHESFPPETDLRVDYDGAEYDADGWLEWLDADEADVTATHVGEMADGRPAVVSNDVGGGSVTYVGAVPGRDLATALLGDELDRAGVPHTDQLPDGVRVGERDGTCWVTNFTSDAFEVVADDGTRSLGAFDVARLDVDLEEISVRHEGEKAPEKRASTDD